MKNKIKVQSIIHKSKKILRHQKKEIWRNGIIMSKTSRSFEPVRWLVINNKEQLQEVIQALIQ